MVTAFVLINCDLGKEEEVVQHLLSLNGVREIRATHGVYDVIAKVESKTEEELEHTINSKILPLNPINQVLALKSK